jgi:hypothetical protein
MNIKTTIMEFGSTHLITGNKKRCPTTAIANAGRHIKMTICTLNNCGAMRINHPLICRTSQCQTVVLN